MIRRFETSAAIPLWRAFLILALASCYGFVLLVAGGAGNAAGAGDHWLLTVSWQEAATETSDSGPGVTPSGPALETAGPSAAPMTVPALLTPAPAVTPRPSPSTAATPQQEPGHPQPAGDPSSSPAAANPAAPPGPPSLFNGRGHRADKPKSSKAASGQTKGGKP
jgi:hypothetical protein